MYKDASPSRRREGPHDADQVQMIDQMNEDIEFLVTKGHRENAQNEESKNDQVYDSIEDFKSKEKDEEGEAYRSLADKLISSAAADEIIPAINAPMQGRYKSKDSELEEKVIKPPQQVVLSTKSKSSRGIKSVVAAKAKQKKQVDKGRDNQDLSVFKINEAFLA